jgi:hypothetical protein
MSSLRAGTDEHKDLFCRVFVDTHEAYDPAKFAWPDLDASAVQRLRSLPFWGEAVGSERTAAARVRAMANAESDPALRDAVGLQAYEEERHAVMLQNLLKHYDIPLPPEEHEPARDPEWGFMRMGYGECFDSFFAFGLFKIASETGFFPPALVKVFDGVMQEEARHILFFTNWAVHRGAKLPPLAKPRFLVRRFLGVAYQALGRVKTALQLRDADSGDDFTMQVPDEIAGGDDITIKKLAQTCLGENTRRLAPYDARLLRPRLVPGLVGFTLKFLPG